MEPRGAKPSVLLLRLMRGFYNLARFVLLLGPAMLRR
jgi:hypothetical protein